MLFFSLNYPIPFGDRQFFTIQTSSNGILKLGGIYDERRTFAFLAPFWENLEPNVDTNGRVYYQASGMVISWLTVFLL